MSHAPFQKPHRPAGEWTAPTNAQRGEWARIALQHFTQLVGQTTEDDETNVTDLLADLMHLCAERGVNFETCLFRGREHFDAEVTPFGIERDFVNEKPTPRTRGRR